jgi:hypothetical protein
MKGVTPDYLADIAWELELRDDGTEGYGALRTSHRDAETYLDLYFTLAYPHDVSEAQ